MCVLIYTHYKRGLRSNGTPLSPNFFKFVSGFVNLLHFFYISFSFISIHCSPPILIGINVIECQIGRLMNIFSSIRIAHICVRTENERRIKLCFFFTSHKKWTFQQNFRARIPADIFITSISAWTQKCSWIRSVYSVFHSLAGSFAYNMSQNIKQSFVHRNKRNETNSKVCEHHVPRTFHTLEIYWRYNECIAVFIW